MKSLSVLTTGIDKVGEFFLRACAFLLLLMLITVLYDVLMRYFFSRPTSWALEINEYFFIFLSIMPAAEILRQKRHIGMDLFLKKLHERNQIHVEIFYLICMLFFSSIVVWRGFEMTANAYKYGMASSSLLSFPLFIPYSLIPAGFGWLGLQLVVQICRNINMLWGEYK